MKRNIIRIDESKCNGCGACVPGCHEGALQIIDGKARLVKDIYCDGLGACLGHCPTGALIVEEREAPAFDEQAVKQHLARMNAPAPAPASAQPEKPMACGCPGSMMRELKGPAKMATPSPAASDTGEAWAPSALRQWPVQLKLVPPHAPYLAGAEIVVCADCVPFAIGDFHHRYLKGRAVLVGCPKLDDLEYYYEKLEEVFETAKPSKVIVLRMQVPCCGGIAQAVQDAHAKKIPQTPLEVHVIGIEGEIERKVIVG